jgi:hypothetical protein
VARKQRHRAKGQSEDIPFVDIRNKLLIAKSEHMFANREAFVYEELLPFLHPSHSGSHNYTLPIHADENTVSGESSVVVERGHAESSKQKVQNQKKEKHASSTLSPAMAMRLMKYYETIPIEKILLGLQESERARVVPPLRARGSKEGEGGEGVRWWT